MPPKLWYEKSIPLDWKDNLLSQTRIRAYMYIILLYFNHINFFHYRFSLLFQILYSILIKKYSWNLYHLQIINPFNNILFILNSRALKVYVYTSIYTWYIYISVHIIFWFLAGQQKMLKGFTSMHVTIPVAIATLEQVFVRTKKFHFQALGNVRRTTEGKYFPSVVREA